MTTADPQPPRPGFWERRILAKAQAEKIRIEARERAAADADLTRAQAATIEVTATEMALASAHNERMRQLEEEKKAAELARQAAADLPNPLVDSVVTAWDKGDRLWAVILTVPLLLGSTAAMFGQVAALKPRLVPFAATELGLQGRWITAVAFAVAFAIGIFLETIGLFMARLAHKARLRKDSPAVYRTVMWAVVLYASGVNYHEWSPGWTQPSVLGVLFASISVLSVVGWELREHRADRDRRAAEIAKLWAPTPIPPRPEFGAMRWIVAFQHTRTAWAVAVRERIADPNEALARADAILNERARADHDAREAQPRQHRPVRRPLVQSGPPARADARPSSRPTVRRNGLRDRWRNRHAKWDVDVFADDLPGVPTLHLVDRLGDPEPPAQEPPADPPARPEPASRPTAAQDQRREAGRADASRPTPPGRDQQQKAAPAREGQVSPIEKAADPAEVKAGIRAYRDRNHGSYPTPNWVKSNLGCGPARAKKLLAEVHDEDTSQEATG
ncbi:DUF2637 domain-containing protein [Actinosynnema sp. NPDC051121]